MVLTVEFVHKDGKHYIVDVERQEFNKDVFVATVLKVDGKRFDSFFNRKLFAHKSIVGGCEIIE